MALRSVRAKTLNGSVRGLARDGVVRWRSIPYARAPVGVLRLRAPQPASAWREERDCQKFAFCAPQRRRYTIVGVNGYQAMSEDCLTVNVVAPAAMSGELLPVIFFVHGGGYMLGSSATGLYDGAALARRGCVFVSVNYRLGALGGMDLSSLSTPQIPIDANLALRDLVLALQWVHGNVTAFGGDPDNVTIVGHSGGAQAVVTLLAVPAARGLFAKVISESPASGLIRTAEGAVDFAEQLVAQLGGVRSRAAATLLQAKPADLVQALNRILSRRLQQRPASFVVGPTVDGDFLPRDPIEAMRCGEAHRVPMIIGNNGEEGQLFRWFSNVLPHGQEHVERMLANLDPAVREQIIRAYPDYPQPVACLQLSTDFVFGSAAWQLAEAHSTDAPTYVYRYDYAPPMLRWMRLGATHGTELLAVFDIYRSRLGRLLARGDHVSALRVSDDIQSRWLAFSRSAVPGNGWPACASQRAVRVFDRDSRVEMDPDSARRAVWSKVDLTQ